jgi:class 3 adenylate cyclase
MWGAAMDVVEWLRGLGLGQYETNFRDNKIDADLLPRLTDAVLKDIGVFAVGDRLRLLDAIAALAGAKAPADVLASPSKPSPARGPQVSAERRPITVMFCDLVGSTGLAAKLDPEDWRNLVNAYLDEASAAVAGLGGHVLKKLGDGLMALFGYPQAQENDAERAVRAALAIQRALAEINAKNAGRGAPELLARIGLESGPVVVEATGEVFGDAPNVAARVQAAAEPGSVLVTMNVQRQIAGLFVAEERIDADRANPARWRGHLDHLLPNPEKIGERGHHAAMPYGDVPAFAAKLRSSSGSAAKALLLAILCASRSSEVFGMTWDEVDLDAKLWVAPGERMKMASSTMCRSATRRLISCAANWRRAARNRPTCSPARGPASRCRTWPSQ